MNQPEAYLIKMIDVIYTFSQRQYVTDVLISYMSISVSLARISEMLCAVNDLKPTGHLLDTIGISLNLGQTVNISANFPVASDMIKPIWVWRIPYLSGFGDSGACVP